MHADETAIDISLVGVLIAEQFPHWQGLALEPVLSAGTDNAIFRLGADLAVRLPRIGAASGQIDKEYLWLPRLAPMLPLAVPVPLAMGQPAHGYPFHWSVCRWLRGDNAVAAPIADLHRAAEDLAHFMAALRAIDAVEGPVPGQHNFHRGVPLAARDAQTQDAIAALDGKIDTSAAAAAWQAALNAPAWQGPPTWIHGDLHPANLLVDNGSLSAVIDFGGLGVGDPACDFMVGWTLLSQASRETLRTAVPIDDATWQRGRGWALSFALIALPYYLDTNPALAGIARRTIEEVFADHTFV